MYVRDFLKSRGVWFETLLHNPASCSTKRAGNAHIPGRRVAKAVLVKVGESFVLAVLPSTSWIDLGQLSAAVGSPASLVRLATPDELLEIFADCEPGVVPPFGRLYGLSTVVDSGLAELTDIVVGANTRHEGLRMHFHDFQTLEQPTRASFTRPIGNDGGPNAGK
jgi:Ala-tRNA(Pro) deacylase